MAKKALGTGMTLSEARRVHALSARIEMLEERRLEAYYDALVAVSHSKTNKCDESGKVVEFGWDYGTVRLAEAAAHCNGPVFMFINELNDMLVDWETASKQWDMNKLPF